MKRDFMPSLLIRNCDALLFDEQDHPSIRHNQDILIDKGTITSILPSEPTGSTAAEMIEGKGLLALPGLINTHAHVPMVLFRGLAEDVTVERWFNEFIWPLESAGFNKLDASMLPP